MKTLFSEISAEGTCICNLKKLLKHIWKQAQINAIQQKKRVNWRSRTPRLKLEEQNPKIDTSDSDLDTDLDTDT